MSVEFIGLDGQAMSLAEFEEMFKGVICFEGDRPGYILKRVTLNQTDGNATDGSITVDMGASGVTVTRQHINAQDEMVTNEDGLATFVIPSAWRQDWEAPTGNLSAGVSGTGLQGFKLLWKIGEPDVCLDIKCEYEDDVAPPPPPPPPPPPVAVVEYWLKPEPDQPAYEVSEQAFYKDGVGAGEGYYEGFGCGFSLESSVGSGFKVWRMEDTGIHGPPAVLIRMLDRGDVLFVRMSWPDGMTEAPLELKFGVVLGQNNDQPMEYWEAGPPTPNNYYADRGCDEEQSSGPYWVEIVGENSDVVHGVGTIAGTNYRTAILYFGEGGEPEPCPEPIAYTIINGVKTGETGVRYVFTAEYNETATAPVEFVWSPEPDDGQGDQHASYSWGVVGAKAVSVEVSNCGGMMSDSHVIIIQDGSLPPPEDEWGILFAKLDRIIELLEIVAGNTT